MISFSTNSFVWIWISQIIQKIIFLLLLLLLLLLVGRSTGAERDLSMQRRRCVPQFSLSCGDFLKYYVAWCVCVCVRCDCDAIVICVSIHGKRSSSSLFGGKKQERKLSCVRFWIYTGIWRDSFACLLSQILKHAKMSFSSACVYTFDVSCLMLKWPL